MTSKQSPVDNIRLVAIDLDGTLLGPRPEFSLYNTFRDRLNDFRRGKNISWVICTGRSLRSFNHAFLPMRSFGIVPDFVITSHAYIASIGRRGFASHWLWNVRVKGLQWRSAMLVRGAMPKLRKMLYTRFPFARILSISPNRLRFVIDDRDLALAAAKVLEVETRPYRYLRVFQYQNEIDVRTVPFTKGLALAQLANHLNVLPEQILVIGDGYNDSSMMDRAVARYTACPANAAPEIAELVHNSGGHIARNRALAGVIEILDAYETGALLSDYPDGWRDPSLLENPSTSSRFNRSRDSSGGPLRGVLLFAAAVYTALLVFASFDVMGSFGNTLMKPMYWFVELLKKVAPGFFR